MQFRNSGRQLFLGSAAVLGALSILPAPAAAETEFAQIIPAEAVAAFWTNDFPAMRKGFEVSPYGKLWADPATEKLRTFVSQKIEEQNELSKAAGEPTTEELLKLLTGGVAMFAEQDGETLSEDSLAFTGIIEIDAEGRAWIEEKVKGIPDNFTDAQKNSFETGGVTVFSVTGTRDVHATGGDTVFYAFTDTHFIYSQSNSDAPVKNALNRMAGSTTDGNFAGRADLAKFTSTGNFDSILANGFVNTGLIFRSLIEGPNGPEPMIRNAIPSTGLYDLESLYISMKAAEDKVDMEMVVATPDQLNGILAALQGAGPTSLDKFGLAPADSLSATSFSLDVGLLWDAIIATAQRMNPEAAGQINMILGMVQMQTGGVDIVNQVLKNFSGEHLVVQRPLDDEIKQQLDPMQQGLQNSTAAFFALKNGTATNTALKTLVENLKNMQAGMGGGNIETEEVDGVTIIRPTSPMLAGAPTKPAFAFNENALLFTNNDVQLMDGVRGLTGKSASSLASSPALQKSLSQVDKTGLHMFSFTPKESVGRSMEQFRFIIDSGMLGDEIEGLTSDMLPPAEVAQKYFGDSWSTLHFENGAIRMKALVNAPAQ